MYVIIIITFTDKFVLYLIIVPVSSVLVLPLDVITSFSPSLVEILCSLT